MPTVRVYMVNELCGYGFDHEDMYQAISVIMQQINRKSHMFYGLRHKDNPEIRTNRKDCWETDVNTYDKESIENLVRVVEHYAFEWCAMKINSMK